jgi:hypothetical protein
MRVRSVAAVAVLAIGLNGCADSASSPSEIPAGHLLEGQAVSAVDGTATGGISVQVGTARKVTTDAAGYFKADVGGSGNFPTTLSGGGIVERQTVIAGPTPARVRVSLIPASFDLRAFDEMVRTANGRLQRWTTAPALVVLASVMSYRGPEDLYTATAEQMSDDEVAQMIADLSGGLSWLTGGTYTAFASTSVERPAAGERTSVTRPGTIVVGRYNGIVTFAQTIGFGRWAEEPDGSVSGGAMFLDRAFDRDDSRRRLLRVHELGHALGYLHVTSRVSIMNPAIGPEPTEFDRTAASIAFQRPPGNVSPDTDPHFQPPSAFSTGARLRWSGPEPCGL